MKLRPSAGFSMVELLVTTAILTSAIYLVMGTMNDLMSGLKRVDHNSAMQALRSNYTAMILDRVAWNNTIYLNPGFACWKSAAGCGKVKSIDFAPYTSDGQLFQNYDPVNNPNQGFALDGTLCNTFDKKKPDGRCPVRLNFKAVPKCAFNSCVRPEFEVQIAFDFSFSPNQKQGLMLSAGGLSKILRTPSASLPLQTTSATGLTVCSQVASPTQLVYGFDSKTGALLCANSTSRVFH